jgi:two-component system sensor histidine kinase/response regulator
MFTIDSLDKLTDSFLSLFKDEFFWFFENSGRMYFSDNLVEITGFNRDELKSIREIVFEEDIDNYKKVLIEFENDYLKDELDLEYRLVRKDKKIVWVNECQKVFRDENGKIIKSVGRVIDISERKLLEEEIERDNKKLRRQNYSKDRFLNLLSHDLKSPFTSILGFTEILIKETSIEESERIEYLSYIYDSSEKLLQLINYLLDWSRLQTGKLQIDSERINIQGLVYNSVSSLTGTAVRKNVDIKTDLDNSLNVLGDERLLSIVITNLINNAIKFSHGNSAVNVKVTSFNNDFIEFIVEDEGVGIPDKDQIKMFKIDSMFSTEGTKGEKGTGFGLTFSKEIVEKHGGELWFYSEENKGSEFHFTVPSAPNTILIVGTEPSTKNALAKILPKEYPDKKIIITDNVYEAIDIVENILPSVIITSHETPLMNGVHLVETLVKGDGNLELKIIIVVDEITKELENAYKKFGNTILVQKSKINDQMLEVLRSVVV